MTMEGLRRIAFIALIIALALVLLVFLGFAAYSMFLVAKWLIGLGLVRPAQQGSLIPLKV